MVVQPYLNSLPNGEANAAIQSLEGLSVLEDGGSLAGITFHTVLAW